ncbi:UNVERIFIED_CONTAM: hypothetical protein Sradi_0471700 [Sesamum radiatum]|uniref:Uncharacterized protein n=1 Tax=Sesamum radiatum TaxID=300843 RepID=A0AAW2W7H8_SESRA
MVAFNKIKVATGEAPLVSAISEDDISTRRAWGLWVCLTEMDKVKYPFKIFSKQIKWIVPVKFHDRKEHRVCREHVRKKKNAHMGKQATCN